MSVSESTIETTLRKAVERAGGKCFKLPAIIYRGIPDRMVLLPGGRLYFVELKKDGGRTEKGRAEVQAAFRKILLNMGFNACQIEGKKGVERFIHDHVTHTIV